jgi:hypothetical protein
MRGMLGGGGRGWRNCLMIDNDDELFGMIIVVFFGLNIGVYLLFGSVLGIEDADDIRILL